MDCFGPTWDDVAANFRPSGRLGRNLDRLGTILGRLGGDLAAKLGSSGRLARVLGAPWGHLETVLGCLGRDFGAKMGPKIDAKIDQNAERNSRWIF